MQVAGDLSSLQRTDSSESLDTLDENINIKTEETEAVVVEAKTFQSPIEVNRIRVISDGVIGVAITLLVVDLRGNYFIRF
jgi:hypothetical protein